MRDLIKKLRSADRSGKGCHLSPEMVRWLLESKAIKRVAFAYDNEPAQRKQVKPVTGVQVRDIRRLVKLGFAYREIAAQLNLAQSTVAKYSSEANYDAIRKLEVRRYEREKQDLELVEKKRTAAREWYRNNKQVTSEG